MLLQRHFNGLCSEKKLLSWNGVREVNVLQALCLLTELNSAPSNEKKTTLPRPLLSETSSGYPGLTVVLQCFSSSHWLKSMLCTATWTTKRIKLSLTCSTARIRDGRSIFQIPKQFYHLWRSCFLFRAYLLQQIHTVYPSTVSFTVWVVSIMKPGNKPEMRREYIEALSIYMSTFLCQQTKGASFLNSNFKCSSLCPSQDPSLQL